MLGTFVVAVLAQAPCGVGERVVMSCAVKQKVLAVCASPGALQYRFGPPGKPELLFPKEREGSLGRFRFERRPLLGGTASALSFVNAGVAYEVFTQDGKDAGGGVNVRGADGKPTTVACTGPFREAWDEVRALVEAGNVDAAVRADRCRRAASTFSELELKRAQGQMDGVQQAALFEGVEQQCRGGWSVDAAECVASGRARCDSLTPAQQAALDAARVEVRSR
ncbi:MAG: hypothetical protein ACOZQL_15625 [Myxococcota bacterium]